MKIRTLSMIAAALLLASSAAWAGSYVSHKSMHQDLACVDCHQEEVGRTPPPSEACLNCHGPMQDLIKKTEGFKRNRTIRRTGAIRCPATPATRSTRSQSCSVPTATAM